MAVKWKELAFTENVAGKTSADWSKSIGSGGDYATWAAMIADMPDLIAHAVTVTIKAGTTLTETCNLKNKHGLTNNAQITIQAEKYFPTSGDIPTVVTSSAIYISDIAAAGYGGNYFNGCWVFIVDGTGTDNGFVPITSYNSIGGTFYVSSWPGTQPDNTSRYIIVGALVDASGLDYGIEVAKNIIEVQTKGIGIKNANQYGIYISSCTVNLNWYSGVYNCSLSGGMFEYCLRPEFWYCGIVKNNTNNSAPHGGVRIRGTLHSTMKFCGLSDNNVKGVRVYSGSYAVLSDNFGNANGTWGVYAQYSGQTLIGGTECSGSSGNHSDAGTAGTASADQAAAY